MAVMPAGKFCQPNASSKKPWKTIFSNWAKTQMIFLLNKIRHPLKPASLVALKYVTLSFSQSPKGIGQKGGEGGRRGEGRRGEELGRQKIPRHTRTHWDKVRSRRNPGETAVEAQRTGRGWVEWFKKLSTCLCSLIYREIKFSPSFHHLHLLLLRLLHSSPREAEMLPAHTHTHTRTCDNCCKGSLLAGFLSLTNSSLSTVTHFALKLHSLVCIG